MGWEDVYPSNAKQPLKDSSIHVLVYKNLQLVQNIPADQWNAQIKTLKAGSLDMPYSDNMRRCVTCVARVWGAFDQTNRKKESVRELVTAMTAFVPTIGPPNVGDLISMTAEIVKDYFGSYRGALSEKIQSHELSQEQLAILDFLNRKKWKKNETLAQWAEQLLDIGEYAIRLVQPAQNPGSIEKINIDAMEEYIRVVRPMLYLYRRDYATLKLASVK